MKKIIETTFFSVIDNLLTDEDFSDLWNFFQTESFEYVHLKRWTKLNRLLDGNSLNGASRFASTRGETPREQVYPFSNILDTFFQAIESAARDANGVIGKKTKDWSNFGMRPYIYPKGSGISWHNDKGDYSGAFAFYVHPYWNCQWGGELLIGEDSTYNIKHKKSKTNKKRILGNHLENELENQQLMAYGFGTYILPKPNRIIFLKSGIHHMIKKVDDCAGDKPRCTYTGFFMK